MRREQLAKVGRKEAEPLLVSGIADRHKCVFGARTGTEESLRRPTDRSEGGGSYAPRRRSQ